MGGSIVLCRRGFMALVGGAAVTAGLVVVAPGAAATTARQAGAVWSMCLGEIDVRSCGGI